MAHGDEVLFAVAAVALFEQRRCSSGNSNEHSSDVRWDVLSPEQCFRLLSKLIRYEQVAFERYACERVIEADRRLQLEEEAQTTRRTLLSYLKEQPDIAQMITIYNDDRGSFRVPVRIEDIPLTLNRLSRFERFLRRSPEFDVAITTAKIKSIRRIRAAINERVSNQEVPPPDNIPRNTEAYVEHDGLRVTYHLQVTANIPRTAHSPVSSNTTFCSSRYNTLQAMAVGLATLAKVSFAPTADDHNELHPLTSDDLDEIIICGRDFFADTKLLLRQLKIQDSGRESPSEPQLDQMLQELDDQLELAPFNCRAISSTRETHRWRALKIRRTHSLCDTSIQQAVIEFFLSATMALIVAKDSVVSLFDGRRLRGAVEMTAASDRLIYHCDISVFDAVKIVARVFQSAAAAAAAGSFYIVDECPKQDVIPRPIDRLELKAWPESEQTQYRRSIRRFLEHQERRKARLTAAAASSSSKSDSMEQRIWRRLLLLGDEANGDSRPEAGTSDETSTAMTTTQFNCDSLANEFAMSSLCSSEVAGRDPSDTDSDTSWSSPSTSSCSSSNSCSNSNSSCLLGTSTGDRMNANGNFSDGRPSSKSPTVTSTTGTTAGAVEADDSRPISTYSASTAGSEGVESIFSDEENRAPMAGVRAPTQSSVQCLGESSCRQSLHDTGQSRVASTSAERKMAPVRGRLTRPESTRAVSQCLGEVEEPIGPEEKRVCRDRSKDRCDKS